MTKTKQKILISLIFGSTSLLLIPFGVRADTLGQHVSLNVDSVFDKYKRTNISATLQYVGDNAYFYIDDQYYNSLGTTDRNNLLSNIVRISSEFSNRIYPKETSFWGSEPNPGIDKDPKLTILLEELVDNNGGYFETGNEYPKTRILDSNERDMIALSVSVATKDTNFILNFLAHEFQHMISFQQKENTYDIPEETWLNELRSEYSISVVGYNDNYPNSNLDHRVYYFLATPSDSLTEWPNQNIDYSMVTLFSEYLAEQYGKSILSETLKSPLTGIESLNKYFQDHNYYEKFSDVFLNWMGALYLNDVSQNPKLGYYRTELRSLHATPKQKFYLSSSYPESSTIQYIKDWQQLWLEYDVSNLTYDHTKSIRIDFSGESGQNFAGAYLAYYDNGHVELGKININSGQGSGFVLNPTDKTLKKVVVLATKTTKISGFTASEKSNYLNVKVSMIENQEAKSGVAKDGALIKRPVEKEEYVIWGKYKRYLLPDVIAMYGQLDPNNVVELDPTNFDSYTTSNYVKYVNDEKVYAIWPDGTKHWLHITPQQWDASGRDWNAIFIISDLELNYYKTGADITR